MYLRIPFYNPWHHRIFCDCGRHRKIKTPYGKPPGLPCPSCGTIPTRVRVVRAKWPVGWDVWKKRA